MLEEFSLVLKKLLTSVDRKAANALLGAANGQVPADLCILSSWDVGMGSLMVRTGGGPPVLRMHFHLHLLGLRWRHGLLAASFLRMPWHACGQVKAAHLSTLHAH